VKGGVWFIVMAPAKEAVEAITADSIKSFEIADVHVSPPTRNPFMRNPAIVRRGLETRSADDSVTARGLEKTVVRGLARRRRAAMDTVDTRAAARFRNPALARVDGSLCNQVPEGIVSLETCDRFRGLHVWPSDRFWTRTNGLRCTVW
jgi:hypothetical protein